jgi:hypothetical protein
MKKHALALGMFFLFSGCGGDDDDDKPAPTAVLATDACTRAPALSDQAAGNCEIRLLSPAPCQEIDLTNDQAFEFRWTTNGTSCPGSGGRFTGYRLHFAGNPVGENESGFTNIGSLLTPASRDVTRAGGVARIRARDLKDQQGNPLSSSDGTFDWTVRSGLEAGPASVVFKIRR